MVHNRDRDVDMRDAVALEMQRIVREAAEPWSPGDSVKAAIGRAARALGLPFRRARTFWYASPCAVRAEEADQLRARDRALVEERLRRLEAEIELLRARRAARP